MHSIWTQTTKFPKYPSLNHDLDVDTLIIGGGLTGLLCGFFLYEQNADYVIIEQHNIAGHTTANTTAKITTQHGLIYSNLIKYQGKETAEAYLTANQDALDKYRQIVRDYDIDCDLEIKSNLIYDLNNRQAILDELEALEKIKAKGIYVERPAKFPFDIKAAVITPNQAQFHPLKFAKALAEIQNIGVQSDDSHTTPDPAQSDDPRQSHVSSQFPHSHIYEETKALAIDQKGTSYEVKVTNPYTINNQLHTIRAKRVIIATHFPFKNLRGLYFMKMHQSRSYVLLLDNINQETLPDYMAMGSQAGDLSFRTFCNESQGPSHTQLILGGRGGKTGKEHGGFTQLATDAKKFFPGCTIEKLWATQDCMTLDQMPYIGNHNPSHPGVKVATGFNKWGMTGAMAAALILTDQMDRELSDIFYPHRPMSHPQVMVNVATSVANLLKLKGPRCSHLGCRLKWNKSEQSWDCPCHGSRYDENGNVLNEPAQKNITQSSTT